jgi:tRNA-intron endonuclease
VTGELVENRIVVWDPEAARALFREGFYGKPLGIPKPKNAEFNAPLILDLIEGYFLAHEGRLHVRDAGGRAVKLRSLADKCEREYIGFQEKLRVYEELRQASFVVTPGIKFGCDFAVYEHGPGIDHAPYLVQVARPREMVTATSIVLSGRLATTVRKQFIVAVCDLASNRVQFLAFDWWRA